MRILVTGATGFIGNALCRRLIKTGYTVRAAVRFPEKRTLIPGAIESYTVGESFSSVGWEASIRDVETIIHLAAHVHVMKDVYSDPLKTFHGVNVAGTECLAKMAVANGVRRFIFLSSAKVNGEGSNVPYAEHDTPTPHDSYGISKMEAEQVLRRIEAETGLEVVILRPPLVYGPRVKANFLQMIEVVNRVTPLPLASIKNQRSLIYLGNLVDAIATCVDHPKAAGQTYLVSDGEDVSTPELIRRLAEALGKPVRLFPFPTALMKFAGRLTSRSEAVNRLLGSLVIDSSKIRRELNWKPPYTMEQGLRETVDWFLSLSGKAGK